MARAEYQDYDGYFSGCRCVLCSVFDFDTLSAREWDNPTLKMRAEADFFSNFTAGLKGLLHPV